MAIPRFGKHPPPGKGRWKASATVVCGCGAEAEVRVISRFDGTVTWCDDTSPLLSRWQHRNDLLGEDEPVCPECTWKHELQTGDLSNLLRLHKLLEQRFAAEDKLAELNRVISEREELL